MTKTVRLILSAFLLIPFIGRSQLIVDATVNETQAVQNILLGGGVTVSNITFSGDANQIGSFDATATVLGIQEGVILATGDIANAIGPNNSGSSSLGGGNIGASDPDLNLIAGAGTNDAAILEFDFVPEGDSVKFTYQFGSDEYLEFVNGGYNDAFGFFLSGPGITGPYSNNAINIAQVPGGGGAVTIDNVNTGSNPAYYVDNGTGSTSPYNTGNQYIQYDGYTVPMVAAAQVQCGQTYHIKIAVADAGDDIYDSGVFLEASSFSSSGIEVDVSTVTGDSTVYEGCSGAIFSFGRPDTTGSYTVYFDIGGSATNGSDYWPIPDSVTFQPGQDSTALGILPIADGNSEGTDTVTITVTTINACGDTIISVGVIFIEDLPQVEPIVADTTLICPVDSILIGASATGGEPPFTYTWGTGQTGDSIWVTPAPGVNYYEVEVQESCQNQTGIDTVIVNANFTALEVVAEPDTILGCPGDPVVLTAVGSGGVPGPGYTYTWSTGANGATTTVNPTTTTDYIVTMQDSCGTATAVDTVTVTVQVVPMVITAQDTTTLVCPGDTAEVVASVTGGTPPYSYAWSNGGTSDTLFANPGATTTYQIIVSDVCGTTTDTTVVVEIPVYDPIVLETNHLDDPVCLGLDIQITGSASGGAGGYTYGWDFDGTLVGGNPGQYSPANSGMVPYNLVVVDQCGNSATLDSLIEVVPCEINVPNVFTPNGDGINDVFQVENIEYFEYSHVMIFNRWGRKIYEASPYNNDWTGDNFSDGTYYYIVTVRNGDIEFIEKGTVTKFSQ